MAVAIIIGVMLFILGWILFIPLVVDVDTDRQDYRVYQIGTFRFWLTSGFQPRLRILGISIPIKQGKAVSTEKPEKEEKSGRKFPFRNLPDLLNGIYQSMTVRWFRLDLDTDDVVLNAQMIPVFTFLSRGPVQLSANFAGRVYVSMRAEVKLYRIGWALLLFFTKK